jgi:gas vesicle protein
LDEMQDALIGLRHAFSVADELWELIKGDNPCLLVPEDVCALGICVPLRVPCNIIRQIAVLSAYFVRAAMKLCLEIVESSFEIQSSRPSDGADESLRIEAIFDNLKSFDSWTTVALETVNKNMVTQHTEMRNQLQDRHEDMVDDINNWTKDVGNYLGNYTKKVTTTLGDHHQSLSDKLTKIEEAVNKGLAAMKVNSTRMLTDNHDKDNDGQAPKLSCAFEGLSLANGLTMNLAAGDNTTLFVMEDISQSAEAIPLVLLAEVSPMTNMHLLLRIVSTNLFPCFLHIG